MKFGRCLRVLGVLLLPLFLVMTAQADTLKFKDGSTRQGKYLGGSEKELRFEIKGNMQKIPVAEIASLTFSAPAAQAPAATGGLVVPAGTRFMLRLDSAIDSRQHGAGHKFTAALEADLLVNDAVAAPQGSTLYGQLTQAKQSGRVRGKTSMTLQITQIKIQGKMHPLVSGEIIVVTEGTGKDTAKKVGRAAAVGALAGGRRGARTGAKWGAAAAIMTKGNAINIPKGTLLEFDLKEALSL